MLNADKREALLQAVKSGDLTPSQLAEAFELSETDVCEYALSDAAQRHLDSYVRLEELRARMLLTRFRANAVVQLVTIATAENATELARRACVDLLTLRLAPSDAPRSNRNSADDEPLLVPTEQAILEALEALGADPDEPPAARGER